MQRGCRGACHISERSEKSKPEFRGLVISQDHVLRRKSAEWIETLISAWIKSDGYTCYWLDQ